MGGYKKMLLFGALWLLAGCSHLIYRGDKVSHVDLRRYANTYSSGRFLTEDGEALYYLKFEPQSKVRGTVIQFHGHSHNVSYHFMQVHWLVESGFRVVSFDYRGYGHSTGKSSAEGLRRDGLSFLDFVCNKYQSRVVAFGQGLGAAVMLSVMNKGPASCVCGLVVDSGFASLKGVLQTNFSNHALTWALQVPLSYLFAQDISPLDAASNLKVPWVLAIHSRLDPVMPLPEGKRLFAALSADDKIFIETDLVGHLANLQDPSTRGKVLAVMGRNMVRCRSR
tara:strand:+ start:227 stop:1066 length:840 start_codon:yes stop_codon:yes gene_type:complete